MLQAAGAAVDFAFDTEVSGAAPAPAPEPAALAAAPFAAAPLQAAEPTPRFGHGRVNEISDRARRGEAQGILF